MDYLLYGGITVGVLILIGGLLYLLKKRSNHQAQPQLNDHDLNQLYLALGQKENILNIDLEHQRLKVDVLDTKKVNAHDIKALNIPAFLTGKTIKLLIKSSPKAVKSYLENKRKEAN